jgi:hypothetical protein
MRIGSGKRPVVNANERRKPLSALIAYLPTRVVRGVAVVAHSDAVVARHDPAVELLAHDVTVHARRGVVGQVGSAARIHERVAPDADGDAEQDREDRERARKSHGRLRTSVRTLY